MEYDDKEDNIEKIYGEDIPMRKMRVKRI